MSLGANIPPDRASPSDRPSGSQELPSASTLNGYRQIELINRARDAGAQVFKALGPYLQGRPVSDEDFESLSRSLSTHLPELPMDSAHAKGLLTTILKAPTPTPRDLMLFLGAAPGQASRDDLTKTTINAWIYRQLETAVLRAA